MELEGILVREQEAVGKRRLVHMLYGIERSYLVSLSLVFLTRRW